MPEENTTQTQKGNLKDALRYASKNPKSDFARQLQTYIQEGKADIEAAELGIDLTPFGRKVQQVAPEEIQAAEAEVEEQPDNSLMSRVKDVPNDFQEIGKNIVENFRRKTERVGGNIARRQEDGMDATEVASTVLDVGAATLSTLTDSIFQAALGTAKFAFTPEQEKEFGDRIAAIGEDVADKEAVKAMVAGWQDFEAKNPEAASNIRNAADFGLFLADLVGLKAGTPLVRGAAQKTGEVAQKTGEVAAKFIKENAPKVGEQIKQGVDNTLEATFRKADEIRVARQDKAFKKNFDETLDVIRPPLNKKETIKVFESAGKPGGLERGKGGRYQQSPDERMTEVAETVQGVVSKNNGPYENLVAINDEIGRVANDELQPFLAELGDRTFTQPQLREYLMGIQKPKLFSANKTQNNTYNAVRETVLDVVNKYEPTPEGLWKARIEVDKRIQEQFGDAVFDSPQGSAVRRAALDMRQGINDFMAELVSEADLDVVNQVSDFIRTARGRGVDISNPQAVRDAMKDVKGIADLPDAEFNAAFWRAKLREMNNLYMAREAIAESNWRLMDKNSLQRWMKENPVKARTIKTSLGIIGLGALGGLGFGLVD